MTYECEDGRWVPFGTHADGRCPDVKLVFSDDPGDGRLPEFERHSAGPDDIDTSGVAEELCRTFGAK